MSAKQYRIYFKLQIAAHTLQKQADRLLLGSGGITTAQAAVLTIINSKSDITQRNLAQQLQQNESAMTAMVKRLQALKMLKRVRSKNDGRAWSLTITAKGEQALKAVKGHFASINQQIETAVGMDGLALFADALTNLGKLESQN